MGWFLPFVAAMAGTALQNKRDKKAYSAAESANEQRRSDYYVNLRNDAQRGGFNPLTALRSGGGMGYSNLAGRITQPLMTRSPLAAGISAGTAAYRELTMARMNQKNATQMQMQTFAHDERMTRLSESLSRVARMQELAMTMSPDGKLPPPNQWWKYLKNKDGSLKLDDDGYAQLREGRKSIPLTTYYRLPAMGDGGSTSFLSLNMESFESGPGEVFASSTVHAGAAGLQYENFINEFYPAGKKVDPFGNPSWSNEWRNHTTRKGVKIAPAN